MFVNYSCQNLFDIAKMKTGTITENNKLMFQNYNSSRFI